MVIKMSKQTAFLTLGVVLICCVSLGFAGIIHRTAEANTPDANVCEIQASSLLLGSQLSESPTAEIRYTLWMDDISNPQELLDALGILDINLQWRQEFLSNGWNQQSICYWAEEIVNIESEKLAPSKLNQFEQTVNKVSCPNTLSVYLEESIDEIINLQAYWEKENITLQQSSHDGQVESWSGYSLKGPEPCISGEKPINVQLTTRKTAKGGKTVLALPALYNDI